MRRTFRAAGAALSLALVSVALVLAAAMPPSSAADGDLDPTFGLGGKVVTAISPLADFPRAAAVAPDGKIVVAGYYTAPGNDYNAFVARYLAEGSLDVGFGSGGVFRLTGPASERFEEVAVDAQGRVVAAGSSTATGLGTRTLVVRLTDGGVPDAAWDGDGVAITPIGTGGDSGAYALAIHPDGRVLVAGYSLNATYDVAIARYDVGGALDVSFGGTGWVAYPTAQADFAEAMVLLPDGRALVAGGREFGNKSQFLVLGIAGDGSLDAGFGSAGEVLTEIGASAYASSIAFLPGGGFAVGGRAQTDLAEPPSTAIARYQADGAPDLAFADNGVFFEDLSGTNAVDLVLGLVALPDGRLVASGYVAGPSLMLLRLLPSGDRDPSFGSDGLVLSGVSTEGRGVSLQGERLVAVGRDSVFTSDVVVSRFGTEASVGLAVVDPVRLLDTRSGAKPVAGSLLKVTTTATPGTPSALVNLTMTRAAAAGFVTADKCANFVAGVAPSKSNGNFVSGVDVANLAVVNLDDDAGFCVYVSAPVDVLVDLQGYYRSTGGNLSSLPAQRLLDTRGSAMPAKGSLTKVMTNAPAGAYAVLVNLTMTRAAAAGFITADKCANLVPGVAPSKSNGNFTPGVDIANGAVVALDADGGFCVYASQSVDLLVDLQGAYVSGAGLSFKPVAAQRVLDTRSGPIPVAGSITKVETGVPAGTVAVSVNLTMTAAVAPGFITADRCSLLAAGPQAKSNGNFVAGVDIANSSVVNVDSDGSFCIYASQPVHLLADLQGRY